MFLCICKSVTDREVRQAVNEGARTMGDLNARFGIGNECGKCIEDVSQCLDACLATAKPTSEDTAKPSATPDVQSKPTKPAEPAPEPAAWFAVDL